MEHSLDFIYLFFFFSTYKLFILSHHWKYGSSSFLANRPNRSVATQSNTLGGRLQVSTLKNQI